jgi:serine/threonine-protein kinase HipA
MNKRCGNVFMHGLWAGTIEEGEAGYTFWYDANYLQNKENMAVSLTLPLSTESYHSKTLFAFFDGLIPEGWLLEIAIKNWKLNPRDRMELLLNCCQDCIGAVSVIEAKK